MASAYVHPGALIEAGAELGEDVYIGPFCTVSAKSKIGARSRLVSHVVFEGNVETGPDNIFHPFCLIGGAPQDLGYKDEPTKVEIGTRNVFRESVSIHRGTPKDRGVTTVGNDNFIMGYCHVAHDCVLGDKIIMANQTALAGHVSIGNSANIGGQTSIVQRVRIGEYTFIGAGSVIRRDLPTYMAAKEFSQVSGPNLIGLKRQGVSEENVRVACELYKIMYLGSLTTEKAMSEIKERFASSDFARKFIDFVNGTKIGIQR